MSQSAGFLRPAEVRPKLAAWKRRFRRLSNWPGFHNDLSKLALGATLGILGTLFASALTDRSERISAARLLRAELESHRNVIQESINKMEAGTPDTPVFSRLAYDAVAGKMGGFFHGNIVAINGHYAVLGQLTTGLKLLRESGGLRTDAAPTEAVIQQHQSIRTAMLGTLKAHKTITESLFEVLDYEGSRWRF